MRGVRHLRRARVHLQRPVIFYLRYELENTRIGVARGRRSIIVCTISKLNFPILNADARLVTKELVDNLSCGKTLVRDYNSCKIRANGNDLIRWKDLSKAVWKLEDSR